MRTGIKLTGVTVLVGGATVEVAGVLYANSILQHNAYGFAGGILAVLGIIAISQGTRNLDSVDPTCQQEAVSNLRRRVSTRLIPVRSESFQGLKFESKGDSISNLLVKRC